MALSSTEAESGSGSVGASAPVRRRPLPRPSDSTRLRVEAERVAKKARVAEAALGQSEERQALRNALAAAATVVTADQLGASAAAGGGARHAQPPPSVPVSRWARQGIGVVLHNEVAVTITPFTDGRPPLPSRPPAKGTRGGVLL